MTEFVDTHAHVQGSEFDDDRDAVIERARAAGVTTLIVPGVDVETSRSGLELANRHEGVYAAIGIHPHEASHLDADARSAFVDLLEDPRCVAVGETGLDFYRMHSTRDEQIEALLAMLTFAAKIELPVVIHCRDAWDALAEVLEPWARALAKTFRGGPMGVLHYFSSDLETARRYVDLGFMISIHTSVTHPKSTQLREVAAALPLESLVIETDSPYGAPQSQRGKRNEPAFVAEAASLIAELRGISLEDVASATTDNACRLFNLPVPSVAGARS